MYDMTGFDYDISDVVNLLKLQVRHKNSVSLDVNCPFCGETKGKMNVNLRKNVFRCNRCDLADDIIVLNDGMIKYSDTYENTKNQGTSLIELMR